MTIPLSPDANQVTGSCECAEHVLWKQQLADQTSELAAMRMKIQQLEEALAASEARCRTAESTLGAILNSPVAAISYGRIYADRRMEAICLSAGLEAISGYSLAELQANPSLWLSRIHPEDLEQVVLPFFEHLFAGKTHTIEHRFYRKDGSLRWVSAVCTSTWDEAHGCWELIGFFQDVTDRQQLLQALRTSETKLSDILNTTLVAITSFYVFDDRRVEYNYGSAGCELVFGYTAEEFLTDSNLWLSRVHPDDRFIAVQFSHQFSPGKIIEQEYRFFHKDGRLRWLMSKLVARRDQALGCWVFTSMDTDITDRKQTELALNRLNQTLEQEVKERTTSLAERNAELESMFRAFPDLLFRLTADGTHLDYKSQGLEVLYCPPEEFIGRKIQDVLPPPAGQQLFAAIQTCLQSNTIVDVNYTLPIHGCQEYYEARIVPYKPDQVLQIVRNVTQQKQAERALYQSEALFRQLFEEAPIAIILADPETGKIIRCNPLLSEMTGYSLAELMTMNCVDFTHAEDIAADLRGLHQLLTGVASRYQMEKRYIHKDGHELWVHLVVCLIRDQVGNPLYALGMLRDITESKRIEAELVRNRDLFQAMFEESADAIFLVDQTSLLITTCNQRAVELFEVDSRAELVGVYGPTLHKSPLTPEQEYKLFTEATERGCAQLEVEYLTKTGRSFWGSLAVKLITVGGKLMRLVRVTDISDRKRTDAQLEASLQEKDILLQEIHHRVKNNMQIVSSLLRMQARRTPHQETASALQEAQQRIQSIALLHEQLYRSPDFAQIDMKRYIHDLVHVLAQAYKDADTVVNLVINIDAISLSLTVAMPCGLIINELVVNALKHAFPNRRSGKIIIALHKQPLPSGNYATIGNTTAPQQWLLSVCDDGIGMPKHPYSQSSPSLGLQIVSSLVQQLHGKLTIDCTQGTSIQIEFPYAPS